MKHERILISLVLAGAVVGVGCGDDDGDPMMTPDSGMMTGMDSGPPPDTGPEPDTGPTPDTGPEPDSGPEPDAGPPIDCPAVGDRAVVPVMGDLTADTTWTCDNIYRLDTPVYVRNTGAGVTTLTIEPGTLVQGASGANALVITTSGRIDAQGTEEFPITFTSAAAAPVAGDWGGVVLLGRANINIDNTMTGETNIIEGLSPDEARGEYGGTDDAHNCGTLRYVRIQYGGFVFGADNELNGLTLGACGSATTLDYIHVHKGLDDGIEFFGGTASLRHAVVSQADDDSVDWDEGFTGTIQFLIVQQAGDLGDRGFEGDNLAEGQDNTPRSEPTIYNATLVGQRIDAGDGMRLRDGTGGHIFNTIVTNFAGDCVEIQHAPTTALIAAGDLEVRNSITHNCGADGTEYFEEAGTTTPAFGMPMYMNRGIDPMLGDPTNETAPNFVPAAASPAGMMGATPPAGFDTTAAYVGAVEPGAADPWYAGWTAFP